jgi:hypothetical protein
MVLASARLRGIHPPDNIQNGGCPGGECLSNAHWLGPWRQHFDDESWRGRVTRVGLLCTLFCDAILKAHFHLRKFPRTENFPKISLLKVENFQLPNFFPTENLQALKYILQGRLTKCPMT